MADDGTSIVSPYGVPTPKLGLIKPTVGGDVDIWGGYLNSNFDTLDYALVVDSTNTLHQALNIAGQFNVTESASTTFNITSVANFHIASTSWFAGITFDCNNTTYGQYFRTNRNGVPRWIMEMGDDEAENGGNTGCNFIIQNFDDSGNQIGTPFEIDRKSGRVTIGAAIAGGYDSLHVLGTTRLEGLVHFPGGAIFSGLVGAPTPDVNDISSAVATTNYVYLKINSMIGTGPFLPLAGGTVSGQLNANNGFNAVASSTQSITFTTSGAQAAVHIANAGYWPALTLDMNQPPPTGARIRSRRNDTGQGAVRWEIDLGDATPETGGNSGSNFSVNRSSDDGTQIDSPLTINRASGAVTINGQVGPFLSLAGGSMTGRLNLSADATTNMNAVTLQQLNAGLGKYVPLAGTGGSPITGAIAFSGIPPTAYCINAGGSLIANVADPVTPQEAATKNYVDGLARTNFIYDLLQSGAAGDGVTDDTSKIQTWLNGLPRGAQVRVTAPHQFLIDSADLTIPLGVTLAGEGALLETPAGVAGGNLSGPAFILNPLHTIVVDSGDRLANFKILRKGLLSAPTSAQVNSAVAAWAAEAPLRQMSAAAISGATTLSIANTTGISAGMAVYGQSIQPGTTVVSVVVNTSVTLSAGTMAALPIGTYVRFGASIGVRVRQACGGTILEGLFILGFNTAILCQGGRQYYREIEADCTTILNVSNSGDAGYVAHIHATPYYGNTTGVGTMRPGPAFIAAQADGWYLDATTAVGWALGHVFFGTGGATAHRCWTEPLFNDGATVTTSFLTQGGVNVLSFDACISSGAAVGFDFQHTGLIEARGCTSAPAGDGTQIAHYRLGPSSQGAITGAMINTASTTPVVVQSGVGAWKIVSPVINPPCPQPWISIAAGDVPSVSIVAVKTNDPSVINTVQSRFNEKVWIARDDSPASSDGSPTEPLAVESLQAGTGDSFVLSLRRNGTRYAWFSSEAGNNTLGLHATQGMNLNAAGGNVMLLPSGGVGLNVANQGTPSGAYVQIGSATSSGAYLDVVGGAPLKINENAAATTIGGSLAVAGATTLAALSASGSVSGAGFTTWAASPPAIGGTTPAAGAFTTLTSNNTTTLTGTTLIGGNNLFQVGTGSVDSMRITPGAAASNAASIGTIGSDTNIDMLIACQGTGRITCQSPLAIGTQAGPNIRAGTGAATGTQPSGSLWLRTDGAAGARIYVSAGAGTWAAIAGV